jgi:hypothetical protein
MKKAFFAFGMLLMTSTAANAGALTHRLSSSVQLTVDAAATRAVRVGHNFSTSGNNVSTTDGTTSGVVGNSVLMTSDGFTGASSVVTASQATSGEAFSFSSSYTQGDAVPSAAVNVGDVANFGDLTSTAAGITGSLAGTIDTSGAISITAGGAGTSAISQFVSEVSIFE